MRFKSAGPPMLKGYIVTCLAFGCMGAHLYPSRPQMTNEHNADRKPKKKTVTNLNDRCWLRSLSRPDTAVVSMRCVHKNVWPFSHVYFCVWNEQAPHCVHAARFDFDFAIFIPYFGCHVFVGRSALLDTRQWLIWLSAERIECCFLQRRWIWIAILILVNSQLTRTRSTIMFETLWLRRRVLLHWQCVAIAIRWPICKARNIKT